MKKYLSFFAIALFILGFAACSDVPAPYGIFDGDIDDNGGEESSDVVTNLPYAESFSSSLGKFRSINIGGSGNWVIEFSTAKAAGYDNNTKVTTPGTYLLVSPEIQLPNEPCHVSFEYILRYVAAADNQQLLISDTWNEDNPAEGWTLINNVFTEGTDWTTFSKADINIPEQFQGKPIRIALRYNCGESGSTWEVRNIVIDTGRGEDGKIDGQGGEQPQPSGDYILYAPFSSALTSNLGDFLIWDDNQSGYNWIYHSTYKCAYISSYESSDKVDYPADSWLISPAFDLSNVTEAYVTLDYKMVYASGNNDEYRVLIGKGFSGEGSSPGRINWTQLPVTWTMLSSFTGASWSNTGKLAIPAEYLGQSDIRVAIEYISTTKSAIWEIQNLIVAQGAGDSPSGGGGQPDITASSVTVVAANIGVADAAALSNYNFNENVSWTFAQNEGSSTPKYYKIDKSARLYAQNSITITSLDNRPIKTIVINCVPTHRGNEQMTTSRGTISKNAAAETVTISDINAPDVTIKNAYTENKSGTQLRIVSMEVIYNDGSSTRRR